MRDQAEQIFASAVRARERDERSARVVLSARSHSQPLEIAGLGAAVLLGTVAVHLPPAGAAAAVCAPLGGQQHVVVFGRPTHHLLPADRQPPAEDLSQPRVHRHEARPIGLDALELGLLGIVGAAHLQLAQRLHLGPVVPHLERGDLTEAQPGQEHHRVEHPPVGRDLRAGDDGLHLLAAEDGRRSPLGIGVLLLRQLVAVNAAGVLVEQPGHRPVEHGVHRAVDMPLGPRSQAAGRGVAHDLLDVLVGDLVDPQPADVGQDVVLQDGPIVIHRGDAAGLAGGQPDGRPARDRHRPLAGSVVALDELRRLEPGRELLQRLARLGLTLGSLE